MEQFIKYRELKSVINARNYFILLYVIEKVTPVKSLFYGETSLTVRRYCCFTAAGVLEYSVDSLATYRCSNTVGFTGLVPIMKE